jgi:hypothetical protein
MKPVGGSNLSKCTRLSPTRTRSRGRDTRELDRGHAIPEHGPTARAEERSYAKTRRCGVKFSTGLTRARRSAAALALDPVPAPKIKS